MSAAQVIFQALTNLFALYVQQGRLLLCLLQISRRLVLDLLLASSVQWYQACALTVDLDSILTALLPAQHVPQEPSLPGLTLSALIIVPNVLLGFILPGEHLVVL